MKIKRGPGRPLKTTPTHPVKIRISMALYTLLVNRVMPKESLGEALEAYINQLKEIPHANKPISHKKKKR